MTDIVEFLRARYAEDRQQAQAELDDQRSLHARRQRAQRVLDDADAKLKIVGLYTYLRYNEDDEPYFCGSGEETWYETLCLLALPYAEHTDYDQRWRPADV